MDLYITITDEDEKFMARTNVYQDGSDSEGAADIIAIIGEKFSIDPMPEICHNCNAVCPNWPKCDECGKTHTIAGRCTFCGEQGCPHDNSTVGAHDDIDLDDWCWLSIRDRFDTLSNALDVPPDSHEALAAELRSIARWIGQFKECNAEDFDTGRCVRLRGHAGNCVDDCGVQIETGVNSVLKLSGGINWEARNDAIHEDNASNKGLPGSGDPVF